MVGALNTAAESWFRYMASATTQATLLAAFILAVICFGRRWSPALKHGLLMLALVKFAVPPTFNLPTGLFSRLRPARSEAAALPGQGISPGVQRALWPEESEASGRIREAGAAKVEPVSPALPTPVPAIPMDAPEPLSAKSVLMLLQFAGAFVILLVVIRQHLHLKRMTSLAVPASDPDLLSEYSSLCHKLGLRRIPALLIAESHNAPIAFGLWNRVVLLPQNLVKALPLTEISLILGHELAHHRRHDLWFQWLQAPLLAIWWFHPAYWLLSRKLRSLREDCCDDLVLSCGLADGDIYCRALLQAARIASGNAVPGASFASIGESHPLRRRFRRLLSAGFSPGPKLAASGLLLVACLGLLLLPGIKPGSFRKTQGCPCEPSGEIREALAALPDMHDMRLPREERLRPLRTLAERYPRDIFVQTRLQDSFAGIPTLYPEIEAAFTLYRSRPGDPLYRYLNARLTGAFDIARAEKMLEDLAADEPGLVWAHFEQSRLTDTPGFRDPEKAEHNLRIFLEACPKSLEGYSMLRTVDDLGMVREGTKKFRKLMEASIDSNSLPYWRDLWDLEFRAARKGEQDEVIRRITADVAAMRSAPRQPPGLRHATFRRAFKLTRNDAIVTYMDEKAETNPPNEKLRGGPGGARALLDSFYRLDSPYADNLPLTERLGVVDRVITFRQKWPDYLGEEDPPFAILLARKYVRWRTRLDEIPNLAHQALRQAEVSAKYSALYRNAVLPSHDPVAEARAEGNQLVAEAYRLQGKHVAWEAMRREMSEVATAPHEPLPDRGSILKYEESLADFKAMDLQGRTWQLDDLKGKATLVNIWSAEGRLDDHVSLEPVYERIKDRKDVQILTFCWDLNPYLAERHIKANGYRFPTIISRTLVERLFPFSPPGRMRWWIIDARGRRSSTISFTNPWLNWRMVSELMMAAAAQ